MHLRKFWIPSATAMRHNTFMKNVNRLLASLAFIGLFAPIQTLSADSQSAPKPKTKTWYQIEILVYEPVEQALANESWPAVLDTNKPESPIELIPISEPTIVDVPAQLKRETTPATPSNTLVEAFQQLPPESLTLAETANKLIQSSRYRIITLQGWQQPVKQRHEADAVHLTDKPVIATENNIDNINAEFTDPRETTPGNSNAFDLQDNTVLNPPGLDAHGYTIINPASEPNAETIASLHDESELMTEEIPGRIDGTVTVSLSRYLHMALNMRYYNPDVYLAEQIAQQKIDDAIIDTFQLKQSRRMRSKEVHVFDHPYFGIIATIIPVERGIPTINEKPVPLLSPTDTQSR